MTGDDDLRYRAVTRLWQATLDELEIVHPDPGTTIKLFAQGNYGCPPRVVMEMSDLRDTDNRDRMLDARFRTFFRANTWYGAALARYAVAGAWALYMHHESLELVRTRKRNRFDHPPPWHPHAIPEIGRHQQRLNVCFTTAACQVENMARFAVTDDDVNRASREDAATAAAQVANEMAYLRGEIPVWQ